MIFTQTINRCDLCGSDVHETRAYRIQHFVETKAGIALIDCADNKAWNQASEKIVCFECCKTIRKTTGGG